MKIKLLLFLVLTLSAASVVMAERTQRPRDLLRERIATDFIVKYCRYDDSNPIHQSESDSISCLIQKILTSMTYGESENIALKNCALTMFYENSVGFFEDAADVYRMGKRRSLCLIALALLGDEYRYEIFMNDARRCLSEIDPNVDYDRELFTIDIVEVLIMMNFNHSRTEMNIAIETLHNNVHAIEDVDPRYPEFKKDYLELTNLIVERIKDSDT